MLYYQFYATACDESCQYLADKLGARVFSVESSTSALLVREELRIPGDFPDMLIWILEIASIPPIESNLCRFDDLGPCLLRLFHHQVDFFLTADILMNLVGLMPIPV